MVAFRVEVWIDFQTTKSESEPPEKPVYSALVTLQNKRKKKKCDLSLSEPLYLSMTLSIYEAVMIFEMKNQIERDMQFLAGRYC
jgi:hypothetical protein